jgi:hypothetical protein
MIHDGARFLGSVASTPSSRNQVQYNRGQLEPLIKAVDRVGLAVDRAAVHREFPDVAFHDFESWAKAQDRNVLLQSA